MGIGTKLRKKNTQKQTTKKKEKKFSSVPLHVLDLRVHLERVNLLINGEKPTDTPANILDWYKMGIATKLRKNNLKRNNKEKEKKTKQNGKSPGTGFPS